MSKIDELIKKHCPDGVEYKILGDCLLRNVGGGTPSKSKAAYWGGDIPWASVKDIVKYKQTLEETIDHITEKGLQSSNSNIIPKGEIIVATRIVPGKMVIAGKNIAINQDLRGLFLKETVLNKFLVYYFQTICVSGQGTTVKGVKINDLLKVTIPIPPLPVQAEIVRILDKFDALTTDLSAGLPAELKARRQQYEYYRDKLLAFPRMTGEPLSPAQE